MSTDEFWTIVEQSRRMASDEAAILAALTADLARRGDRTIAEFEQRTRGEIERLDTPELRDVTDQLWVLPQEGWGSFRAWCVSQGRAFVDALRTSPGRVLLPVTGARNGPFDPPKGDHFLYCADFARVVRTRNAA